MRSLLFLVVCALMITAEISFADDISYIDSCGASSTADDEILLVTQDIQATDPRGSDNPCIAISNEGVTLDCQGHMLAAPPSPVTALPWGIVVLDTGYDVTVRNCRLTGWWMGISYAGQDGLIEGVEVVNGGFGIFLDGAIGNEVRQNKVTGGESWDGIVLGFSQDNFVHHNTVNNKPYGTGIALLGSSFNDVVSNVTNNNGRGLALYDQSDENNIFDNTTNRNLGAGLYLYESRENVVAGNKTNKNAFGIKEETECEEEAECEEGLDNIYSGNVCKGNETFDSNVENACK